VSVAESFYRADTRSICVICTTVDNFSPDRAGLSATAADPLVVNGPTQRWARSLKTESLVLLQTGCPFSRPINSVRATKRTLFAKLTARAHGLDSLVHPKETESNRSYADASLPALCSEDTATLADLCDSAGLILCRDFIF